MRWVGLCSLFTVPPPGDSEGCMLGRLLPCPVKQVSQSVLAQSKWPTYIVLDSGAASFLPEQYRADQASRPLPAVNANTQQVALH